MIEGHKPYDQLASFSLSHHGDSLEQEIWKCRSHDLSAYEKFWRDLIVLLTFRIDPQVPFGEEWIRVRPSIRVEYEALAMNNYSLFYHCARARDVLDADRARLVSGWRPYPELAFFYLQASLERADELRRIARVLLFDYGIKWKSPKRLHSIDESVGRYRNVFVHDPLLGRGLMHGREFLPPLAMLPTSKSTPLLWRDTAKIPAANMIDGLKMVERLWLELAAYLQDLWVSLSEGFVMARECQKFVSDLDLKALIPIKIAIPPNVSSPSISGAIVMSTDPGHRT